MIERRLNRVSSTRSAGLIRIGLALLLWERFAYFFAPFTYTLDPWRLFLAANFWIATSLLLVGLWSRFSAAWTGLVMVVGWFTLGIWGPIEDFEHHHTWLLVTAAMWLPFTPCGHSFSLDRWFAVRRAQANGTPIPAERAPDWGLLLLALQVTSIYWWGAWDKTGWHFLSGDRLEMIFMHTYTGFRLDGPLWSAAWIGGAWAVTIVEYLLPLGLVYRPTQLASTLVGIALHAVIYITLPVGPFSVTMLLLYLSYYHPDDVHQIIETLLGNPAPPAVDGQSNASSGTG